jgi:cytidine deaminase
MKLSDAQAMELLAAANAVRSRAHAPYSRFPVGAAVLDDQGRVHVGCNVENASYPLGVCAERNALAAAVAAGRNRFRTLALSCSGTQPVPPCGGCRQVLAEFAHDLRVLSEDAGGTRREWLLAELLPEPFVSEKTRTRTP